MTEVAESRHEVADMNDDRAGTTFAGFVERLEEETARLRSLAEASDRTARELVDREASLDAREQALSGAQRELDVRREELERRTEELKRLAAQTEQAHARIAEAAEREAGLKALAHELLERYGGNDAEQG